MVKVLALASEKTDGCTLWRCFQPYAEIQRQRLAVAEWGYRDDNMLAWNPNQIRQLFGKTPMLGGNLPLYSYFDAVIMPRLNWPAEQREQGDKWFASIRRLGIAVIYEVDDDMFSDDFFNRLVHIHGKPEKEAAEIRESVLHTIQGSDGVTVSSQRLATIVRQHTDKPVEVVKNYMDIDWFQGVQAAHPRKVKGLTIGWAGGLRPDYDVEQMAIAWGRIAKRFPDVTFVVQGHQAQIIDQHIPQSRRANIHWLPIEIYPAGMANIDIGCCPLSNTYFNRAKTYIKAMEYATGGAAVVASPTVYGQIIEHGKDGYIAQTADEWEQALGELVSSKNHRKRMAQRLFDKVKREHSLTENAWRWPVAWQRIVDDFRRRQATPRILTPATARAYA